jgi:membrane-associated phospholipid phosphatase
VAACWTLLVVLGLLWLHFHWLSDVVGSVLLGSLVLWLLLRWPWRLGERIARH